MSFTDEYYAIVNEQKKKKKEQKTGDAFTDAYNDAVADNAYAPVATLPANGSSYASIDIAPLDDVVSVLGPKITTTTKKKEDDRKWFDTGAFDDGYQFGDVFKTILGTVTDVAENVGAGVIGMGEKALDAIAYVSPLLAKGQYYQNGGAYHDAQTQKMFNDSFAEGKKWSENFIKKDLYDEEEIAKKIVLGTDKNSVLGEKSDALIQSGGQLLGTAALQAAGVPWFLTTGATSFGSQAEVALNDGAGYEEAGLSAAVSAGAEILTEKLSGGIKFGGKTLDDVLLKPLTEKIASKTVKTLVNLGVDAVGEGAEEVVSGVFSNLGTAIYKEKGLEELLFSEEAVDEYIESFIGGAVLGGLGSGVQAIQDNKRIHLTENEQKVVEHETQKRIADLDLTEKQKNNIRSEVIRDMLRGNISTDTIEEVLGGETYQSWKNTVDSEDALQREYDELGKKQNATLAETTRYNELHQQLKDLETTSQRNALKDQLGSEVMSLVQSERLAESYNERSRRGQAFEADISKYDAKQRATIQKAIDSGILNNTNRTHEFVDMIAKITADKGVLFDFTNNEKLKESGFAVDGKAVNGYVTKDGVVLNINSAKSLNKVVGHVITHVLEGTELYDTLKQAVAEYATTKGDYQGRYDALTKTYENVEGADIDAELTADLVGDYLFTDTDFVRNLSVQHRNVFQKIYDEIKYLCKVATAGSKEARELEKVKRAFEDAYRADGKAQSNTKYSLTDSEGVELSSEQQEYFKDSKVRDENGSLLKVYHGSKNSGFNVFRYSKDIQTGTDYGEAYYFTSDRQKASGYSYDVTKDERVAQYKNEKDALRDKFLQTRSEEDKNAYLNYKLDGKDLFDLMGDENYLTEGGEVKEVYLNLTNPLIADAGGKYYYEVYPEYFEQARASGNDGIIVKNVIDNPRGEARPIDTYIAFRQNQIKSTANVRPTKDADIRYSLSELDNTYQYNIENEDMIGAELVVEQAANLAMPDSKIRDKSGKLKPVYHGTQDMFYVFDTSVKGGKNGTAEGFGIYTSDDPEVTAAYGDRQIKMFANITKPARSDKKTITPAKLAALIKDTCKRQAQKFVDDGEYDSVKDALMDTWVSNYVYTYDIGMERSYREVAKNILEMNDSDMSVVQEVMSGIGIRDYAEASDFYRNSLTPITGFDGFVTEWKNSATGKSSSIILAFNSNQLKSADAVTYDDSGNVIPLSERFNPQEADIRRSLSNVGEQFVPANNRDVFGKDIALEAAPVQEATVSEMETVAENATVEENLFPDDLGPVPDDPERFDSLDDADMPPEREMPYGEEEDIYVDDPFEDRDFFEIGNRKVKAYMYENPEVKPFFQAEAINLGGELTDTIKAERWYNDDLYYESGGTKGFGGNKRYTSDSIATLLDDWHMSYADIEKGINAIIEDHGAENIAAAKKIEFMLNDRLMNGYKNFYERGYVEPNAAYLDLIYEKQINEYSKEAFDAFMANADQYAPPVVEDIAPVAKPKQSVAMKAPAAEKYEAIRPKRQTEPRMVKATPAEQAAYYGQQTMKGFEPKTAKVLTDEPKVDPKKPKAWNLFKDNIVDKGTVFETMSLKSGNRELQGKWKAIGRAESSAQWFMEHGNASTKSLKDIRDAVEKSGKTKKFTEYLYHMHNVDRMNLEDRYPDMENKPVFGYGVTSEMSKAEAAKLEKANPEFKRWAQDVYSYNQAQREMMVDNGLISRETADLWAKMYPHYVPVRRVGDEGLNINVALDSKKTGVNAPVKKATGGNRDILPLFDTMAMRTEQTYKAIAKNHFGVELKNMLGTTIDTGSVSVDEMIDNVDMQDGLLQEGKDGGNPTFTVFENGERVTFEITEEMYDTMKPKGKFASYSNKVLNAANNVRRGLLTEYNPAFLLTNTIKDSQDVLINSQHPARTYANYLKAAAELLDRKGQYYQEYMEHGGEMNTFFDGETKTFAKEKSTLSKVIGFPLEAIGIANNFVERVPRMAEYIASRKMGRSIDVSMLDAARVTTDFSAGGDFVKTLNRNGFTFLNASVQGAVQQVRNFREAKAEGVKGWAKLAAKFMVAGLSERLLNHLLWDDDEDYEELSDYNKQNYYIVAKYGDGKFVRIPKGRAVAVIQDAFEQMENLITGNDEVDFDAFAELVISNLAPSNPLENNLIAPIMQAYNNETWYGDDLVPSRLQDLPAAEQFDETTDSLSKWLGEKLNISPYKINYVLDQYSGAIGDMFLPMMTQEAERGNDSLLGNMIAPISDKFTTDSVLKNQNVTDFYSKRDELEVTSNGRNATKEDMLKKVYVDAVSWEMSDLYAKKREIQNSDMSDAEKYEAVREIQKKINALAESGLNGYEAVYSDGAYAEVGDRRFNYYKDKDTWYEIKAKNSDGSDNWYYTQEQLFRDKLGVSYADYWNDKFDPAKNHVKTHYGEMNGKRYNYSEENNMWYEIKQKNDDGSDNWYYQKEQEVTKALGLSYPEYWDNREEYNFAYDHPQSYALAKTVGGYKTYMTYYDALENWQSDTYIASDKDENGDTIYNSRKKKVQAYLKELDIPEMDKLLLYKSVYNSYDDRNYEIIDYLNKSDLTFEETVNALRGLGFDVTDDGDISWK